MDIFGLIFIRKTGLFFASASLFLSSLPEVGFFFVMNRKSVAIGPAFRGISPFKSKKKAGEGCLFRTFVQVK
jgi:hypothetical protein